MVRRLPTPPPRRSSARSPSLTRPGSGPSTPTPAVTFHQEGEHVVQRMMWQLGFASVVFSRASLDYIGISMNSQESVWPAAAGGAYSTITSGSFDPSAEAMAGAQTNALLHNQTSIYVDAVRDNMDNMRVTSPPNLELALTEMNPMTSVIPPKLPSPLVQSELLRLADAEVDMRPPPSPGSLLQSSYEEDLNFLREEREIYLHREATLRWLATLGDERDEGEEESEPKRSHWQQQCLESADYLEGSLESDVESELEAVLSDEPPEEEEAPTDESVCNNAFLVDEMHRRNTGTFLSSREQAAEFFAALEERYADEQKICADTLPRVGPNSLEGIICLLHAFYFRYHWTRFKCAAGTDAVANVRFDSGGLDYKICYLRDGEIGMRPIELTEIDEVIDHPVACPVVEEKGVKQLKRELVEYRCMWNFCNNATTFSKIFNFCEEKLKREAAAVP